jgi:hypothetical protein
MDARHIGYVRKTWCVDQFLVFETQRPPVTSWVQTYANARYEFQNETKRLQNVALMILESE